MRKYLALTVAAIMVATIATPSAFAQRDAAAKARGDMGGFWTSKNRRTNSRPSARIGTIQPAVESYRSFSYVPAPRSLEAGDEAVVTGNDTKMMSGRDVVASVPQGTKFSVTKVSNGWLGAAIEIDGKTSKGWIRSSEAGLASLGSAAPQTKAVQQQVTVQQQPVQEYRSFSYQPAAGTSQTRQPSKKAPWQYLKTDPRRYRH